MNAALTQYAKDKGTVLEDEVWREHDQRQQEICGSTSIGVESVHCLECELRDEGVLAEQLKAILG